MNRTNFYNSIRKDIYNGKLAFSQVEGIEAILQEWEKRMLCDTRKLAYILATSYHETAKTMQPIEEWGKGKGRAYGKPDPVTGKVYYGRGFVQLTWAYNYKTMGNLLGIDLYHKPDLALDKDIAVQIMFEGMFTANSYRGDFTGKHLDMYFTNTLTDWVNARRIINGTDKADLIAGYAKKFHAALS